MEELKDMDWIERGRFRQAKEELMAERAARPSEPSAPQVCQTCHGDPNIHDMMCEGIYAAPQTSAEMTCPHGFGPDQTCIECEPAYPNQNAAAPQPVSGPAPKVEEIARYYTDIICTAYGTALEINASRSDFGRAIEPTIRAALRRYFPLASQTPPDDWAQAAAREICDSFPPEQSRMQSEFMAEIIRKHATPARTARTDGWPDLIYGDHESWCGKYTRNGESNSGGNIGAWYASAVFWRNRAEGILNPGELPAAPGSVPQAPMCKCPYAKDQSQEWHPVGSLGCTGVPQAEPPKEEKP